ncbi:Alpha/Beta hydrolase protein [Podospora didyma]|uniref:Alpha/Beta hydrolase protein n=1 Tax=Podospora didyma TaxID=330526 RepID=A0AAE0U3Y7_9PEZI|nr:Alpha/Beta hydrolase protein [Podospora didyma]
MPGSVQYVAAAALQRNDEYDISRTVQAVPFWQRLKFATIAFLIRIVMPPLMFLKTTSTALFNPKLAASNRPFIIKSYPTKKSLPIRIFLPRSYDVNSGIKLPVLLTIHGGGFLLGSPVDDDPWNAAFASRHNFLVVALNYSKGPVSRFPCAVYDIEALVGCVLSDPSLLPFMDISRVGMAGWSAGGGLCLSAAQLDSVRARVHALVPIYPVADWVSSNELKARTRRYKPELGGHRAGPRDYLMGMVPLFSWAYVTAGQRLDDPLLSPYFVPRERLPGNVFIVGCEMDMLAGEAWRMACKLADRPVPEVTEAVGCQEVVAGKGELILEGDERFSFEDRVDSGRYRWLLVPDTVHGFDHEIDVMVKDPECMADARIKADKLISIVGEWLSEVLNKISK